MKIRTFAALGAIAGVGAYLVHRYKNLEPRASEVADKKLITLEPKAPVNKNYEQKMLIYKFLARDFIEAIYSQRDNLFRDFPVGVKLKVYHQVEFKTEAQVEKFIEYSNANNYEVNHEEDSANVRTVKSITVVDIDTIVEEILTIADKATELTGEYQGYATELD